MKKGPCVPASAADANTARSLVLPEELAQAFQGMAPDLYFGTGTFDASEIRHRDHIGIYSPPGESRVARANRQLGYAAYGVECRAPFGHEQWLSGRVKALHQSFRDMAAAGELAPPMTDIMRAEFISELSDQVGRPDRLPIHVAACLVMLSAWAPDWEIHCPVMAKITDERLADHPELAWAGMPIRETKWQ